MKLYSIRDPEFRPYGQVLEGYDLKSLFSVLGTLPIPCDGITYEASVPSLEAATAFDALKNRCFGGMPIQIGYVGGSNRLLNCLEYHKSSECNIALEDIILVLGLESQIENGSFDTDKCKAFLVPAGEGVELYATTLHYAPMQRTGAGYHVACVLPKGTNGEQPSMDVLTAEDRMCAGSNKWLLVHPASAEARQGKYIGLTGRNVGIADIVC